MADEHTYSTAGFSIEKMLAYLEERLPASEAEQIEQQIMADDLFAQALEELAKAKRDQPAQLEQFSSLKAGIQQGARQEIGTIKSLRQSQWMSYAVAAAVVLILAVAGFQFLNKTTEPDYDQLISAVLEQNGQYEPRIIVRGAALSETINMALQAYQARDYELAIPLLEQSLMLTDSLSSIQIAELQLALGFSHLSMLQLQSADSLFISLETNAPESRQEQEARWYLSLSLLSQQKLESAKIHLQKLATSPGKHQEAAKELVKSIK